MASSRLATRVRRTSPRYRTTNWTQALKARRSLTVWLDKRMAWFAAASGKRGHSPKFSDAAMQFCLTLNNQFGMALGQTTGLVPSVLQQCGFVWPRPDVSTLCRRQIDLNAQVPDTRNQADLHLLVDSTGNSKREHLGTPPCGHRPMQTIGTKNLEALEWRSPAQPGGNQDALHQTIG